MLFKYDSAEVKFNLNISYVFNYVLNIIFSNVHGKEVAPWVNLATWVQKDPKTVSV